MILDYTKGLSRRGHSVGVISPAEKKYIPEHFPVSSSYTMELISDLLDIDIKAFSAIKAKKEIKRFSSCFSPDIYWNHTIGPMEDPFEKNMMESKKPKIISVHSFGDELAKIYTKQILLRVKDKLNIEEDVALLAMERKIEENIEKLVKKRERKALEGADAVIVPTSEAKKRINQYFPEKTVYVVPCGVSVPRSTYQKKDIEKEFPSMKGKKIMLYIGRMACEKNVSLLIESLYEASKKRDDLGLLLIGPGETDDLFLKASALGVEDKVVFAGSRPHHRAVKYYGGADLFLFASESETQGIVIWEAMSSGLPVVVFDLPISSDIYPSGTAFVVDRKEGVRGFSNTILEAISDDEKRSVVVETAKKFIKGHTKESSVIKVEKALKDVLY